MANIPLKTIKFPGLDDTYTVPQIDSSFTGVAGEAPDSKEVKDEISSLREDLNAVDERVEALEEGGTDGGLTEAVKVALLQVAQKVAYIDAHGQDYYDNLYDALYPPATLVRINAVYTQSGAVLTTDTLDSLKADLVVTATYTDQTTETVTNYTLSGTLSEGTSTITASYGGKTATFKVTVTAAYVLIRNWDFTKSLTDTVSGATAITTGIQNSNGLTFEAANQYLDIGSVYSRNRTYEIDIDGIEQPATSLGYYRRVFAYGENGTNTQWNTAALIAAGSGKVGWIWYLGSAWDSGVLGPDVSSANSYSYFNGKTMKIYIDAYGYGHVYAKTIGANDSTYIKVGATKGALTNYSTSVAHVYMGGTSNDSIANARIKAFRVYEGEK